jgi:hypothetical protein
MTKRSLAVGFTGKPLRPVVTLYDLEHNHGRGIDLYFDDVDDLLQTLAEITKRAEQMKAVSA